MASESYVVAAIDIGTTYSGFAFSFLHDYQQDPTRMSIKQWTTSIGHLLSLKTPTCILFDHEGKFNSFGYEAEEKITEMDMENSKEAKKWFFFERFKMTLYNNMKIPKDLSLKSVQGHTMPALKVFSESIRYLMSSLMEQCELQSTGIRMKDISWVLTVPAIWSDTAKKFMREAAELAGIEPNKLRLALEPEAAALYVRHVPFEKPKVDQSSGGYEDIVLKSGSMTSLNDHAVVESLKSQDDECRKKSTRHDFHSKDDDGLGFSHCNIQEVPSEGNIMEQRTRSSSQPSSDFKATYGQGRLMKLGTGKKYMVVDAGGGTVDIAVHQLTDDGKIREIFMANGGDWGGTKVDEAFQNFLADIITPFEKDEKLTQDQKDQVRTPDQQDQRLTIDQQDHGLIADLQKQTLPLVQQDHRQPSDLTQGLTLKQQKPDSKEPTGSANEVIDGHSILAEFRRDFIDDALELRRDFELKKRNIKKDMTSKITIRFPPSLGGISTKHNKKTDGESFNKNKYGDSVLRSKDKLRINSSIAVTFFEDPVQHLIEHLSNIFPRPQLDGADTILMVGGFSESPILSSAIRDAFPEKEVVVPKDAGLAVLKGAVIYGYDPDIFSERISKYTYGVRCEGPFYERVHPANYKFIDQKGVTWCHNLFDIHVKIGDSIRVGEPQSIRTYLPSRFVKNGIFNFAVYSTTSEKPMFVTDSGVTKIGQVTIRIPPDEVDYEEEIMVSMTFSGTELEAVAEYPKTGQKERSYITSID